jgi:hypothetical protein
MLAEEQNLMVGRFSSFPTESYVTLRVESQPFNQRKVGAAGISHQAHPKDL